MLDLKCLETLKVIGTFITQEGMALFLSQVASVTFVELPNADQLRGGQEIDQYVSKHLRSGDNSRSTTFCM